MNKDTDDNQDNTFFFFAIHKFSLSSFNYFKII